MDEIKKLKGREAQRRYYYRNREKKIAESKAYRSKPENKEKHRLWMLEWRKNNPEEAKEVCRRSRRKNAPEYNRKKREKLKNDPKYAESVRKRNREYTASGRRKILYNSNPLKSDILKKRWIKIKATGKIKNDAYRKKYRAAVLIKKEKRDREILADAYVIGVIKKQLNYKIHTADIPKELIEVKKKSIELKRKIKDNAKTGTNL